MQFYSLNNIYIFLYYFTTEKRNHEINIIIITVFYPLISSTFEVNFPI